MLSRFFFLEDSVSASVIIVAGGMGKRLGGDIPKQFVKVRGKMIIEYSLTVFAASPSVDSVVVVVPPGISRPLVDSLFSYVKVDAVVPGGEKRLDSVYEGISALIEDPEVILVHDAARPLINVDFVESLIGKAMECGSAVPALPVTDSLKYSVDGNVVERSEERNRYFTSQTPQAFRCDLLKESASIAKKHGWECSDCAQMVERAGNRVSLIPGLSRNVKVTYEDDLDRIKTLIGTYTGDFRVGVGYDSHRMVKGRELWLGGIMIESDKGLLGHSDGDCALHAIADALLGAAGLGDIGYHYPPGDASIEGKRSGEILKEVHEKVIEGGYRVVNVDCVIICEYPLIAPLSDKMAGVIGTSLSLSQSEVSVKGKTTEGMGFEGKGEGISSMAVVLIEKVKGEGTHGDYTI